MFFLFFCTFCMSSQYFYTPATMCSDVRCHEKKCEIGFLTLQKIRTGRRFPSSENIRQPCFIVFGKDNGNSDAQATSEVLSQVLLFHTI